MVIWVSMSDHFPDPYGDLFIYYLEGCLKPGIPIVDEAFVGNWEEDGHSFLFFKRPALRRIERLISRQPHLKLLDQFHMSYEEWHGQPVRPFCIGRLHISPPWTTASSGGDRHVETTTKADSSDIEILLDPGVVFGTGSHPTTRHCIEALQAILSQKTIHTVIDIGTGTGLLAISAVKLGCQQALAIDLNHLAARTAHRNIQLNGLEKQILALQGAAENFVDLPSDLVISNIHYDVMKRLLQGNRFLHTRFVILSGLLRSQAMKVERLLSKASIQILERWEAQGIWHSFLGRIPDHL